MSIEELKDLVEKGKTSDKLIIMKWEDSSFIPRTYIEEIANRKKLTKFYVGSFEEIANTTNDFLSDEPEFLYILVTDEFNVTTSNFDNIKNAVVMCKKVTGNESVLKDIKHYIVEFPKMNEWQILDYMKLNCSGLDENELKWLRDVSKCEIDRIYNEISKIMIFDVKDQKEVFYSISDEGGYSDLSIKTIYDLTNALLDNNSKSAKEVLSEIENVDIEGIGLVTILLKNFKNIIQIQFNSRVDAQSLGLSPYQFNAIAKFHCRKYNEAQLIDIYNFLLELDYKIKSGNMPINLNKEFIDYIVCYILERGTR